MISKELKRLSRRELVDIIYQLKKNEQQMQDKLSVLESTAEEKRIQISEAGSIAEAAMNITNIFATAQVTAELYLHEIACMKEETEKECAKMIEEAERKVKRILSDGKKQRDNLNARYQVEYKKWQRLQAEIKKLEEIKNTGKTRG